MKTLMLLIMLISCNSKPTTFTILHYNIKELRTHKIENSNNQQVKELIKFLNNSTFDILSLNEVEFNKTNLKAINKKLKGKDLKSEIFVKANTGNNSNKKDLDLVNFGKVPGEYSTGALTRFKVIETKVISELKWRDFFNDDLSNYKLSSSEDIPSDIELFDKSFSDTTLQIENKKLHLILLHTVPSFRFGNPKTINFLRNQRQLEFLKWYINRDGKSTGKANIKPLDKNDTFVVVGDLNVDVNGKTDGAKVLKEIISNNKSWIPLKEMDYTHPDPKLMLDYIIFSKDISPRKGVILKDAPKVISDHLPIWSKLEIN